MYRRWIEVDDVVDEFDSLWALNVSQSLLQRLRLNVIDGKEGLGFHHLILQVLNTQSGSLFCINNNCFHRLAHDSSNGHVVSLMDWFTEIQETVIDSWIEFLEVVNDLCLLLPSLVFMSVSFCISKFIVDVNQILLNLSHSVLGMSDLLLQVLFPLKHVIQVGFGGSDVVIEFFNTSNVFVLFSLQETNLGLVLTSFTENGLEFITISLLFSFKSIQFGPQFQRTLCHFLLQSLVLLLLFLFQNDVFLLSFLLFGHLSFKLIHSLVNLGQLPLKFFDGLLVILMRFPGRCQGFLCSLQLPFNVSGIFLGFNVSRSLFVEIQLNFSNLSVNMSQLLG